MSTSRYSTSPATRQTWCSPTTRTTGPSPCRRIPKRFSLAVNVYDLPVGLGRSDLYAMDPKQLGAAAMHIFRVTHIKLEPGATPLSVRDAFV